MERIFSLLIIVFLYQSQGFAKYDQNVETPCDFQAFVTEQDPKGLNVRAEPDLKSKIIGSIPPAVREKDETGRKGYLIKPEVKVIASKSGWIKIKEAQDNAGLLMDMAQMQPRKMFQGEGWVSGKMLTIKSQDQKAYAAPSVESKVLHKESDHLSFDSIDSYKLIGCQGKWAFVEDMKMKKDNRYWLTKICGTQETTCDGL